ncbi:hypothetical protein O9X80_07810 [Agrobacterium salinitolerans]|uniref:hypothetical protein n=1 Tax=Agrobacterium salinitolerans TaxID=1183413 RepID=UPI0022B814C6|nr:hypothetical protein [Agrobacterium salinitolerans]MCZ7974393.1 hypothetical protein [Agrobacterium salinitolerans]
MTATATIGDNTKAERERRVMLAHYHRKDRDLDAKASSIAAERKENRLNAKASGIPSSQLDHLLKSFKTEDQQKPVDKLKRDMENLAYLGLIPDPSIKGDLFTRVDRVDNEGMIKAKGFFAGLNGLDRVSGYDGGSVDDKLWLESYDAGKAEYDTEIPDIMARITAAQSKEEPAADAGDGDPFKLDQEV